MNKKECTKTFECITKDASGHHVQRTAIIQKFNGLVWLLKAKGEGLEKAGGHLVKQTVEVEGVMWELLPTGIARQQLKGAKVPPSAGPVGHKEPSNDQKKNELAKALKATEGQIKSARAEFSAKQQYLADIVEFANGIRATNKATEEVARRENGREVADGVKYLDVYGKVVEDFQK